VDTAQIFAVLGMAWGLMGVSTALVLGRRGHHPIMWLVLASVLGPLVLPLAVSAPRQDRPGLGRQPSVRQPGPGGVDVLVRIDGSEAAVDALRSVIGILGDRLGRLTLAAVVDYDVAMGLAEGRDRAWTELRRPAEASGLHGTIVLSARRAEPSGSMPSKRVRAHGGRQTRGQGASRTLSAPWRPSLPAAVTYRC
jgi:hypothetical protein